MKAGEQEARGLRTRRTCRLKCCCCLTFSSHSSTRATDNKPHHLSPTMSDEYEHYDDSDVEDEEEEVWTHAEHKAKGNESYKSKGR